MAQTARARPARVRCAAFPVLPEELVLWEILVRLPAKELLRCGAVCRSWRRLTSAPDFLLAHHWRQPSLPLVVFGGQTPKGSRDDALDAFDMLQSPVERRPVLRFNHNRHYRVLASCDGLLLLVSQCRSRFYICNPTTRQWIRQPNLKSCIVLALYPHGSSGEYRILYCNNVRREDDSTFCYVLTAGSSMAPRAIQKCEATGSQLFLPDASCRSVLLDGRLHWFHPRLEGPGPGVLVFDTVSESFMWMCTPPWDLQFSLPKLFEMDGALGMSGLYNTLGEMTMKVWVLQDYETKAWLMKYQIQLLLREMSSIAPYGWSYDGVILSDNGDVLVYSHNNSHLFHCDSTGKLQQKSRWDGVVPRPTGHWFKESVVQHAFFQTKGGRRARKPRFFQGWCMCFKDGACPRF